MGTETHMYGLPENEDLMKTPGIWFWSAMDAELLAIILEQVLNNLRAVELAQKLLSMEKEEGSTDFINIL